MVKAGLKPNTTTPQLCQSKLVFRALVLAQAVAILLALAPGVQEDRWLRLGFTTLFVQWVTLLTLFLLCGLQKKLQHLSPTYFAGIACLLLLSCTTLVSLVAYFILTQKGWEAGTNLELFLIHNLLVALILGIIGFQFYLMHEERNALISAQSRSELDALQARIRPHFLFNSLNTAAELTHSNAPAAESLLLNLATLFRAALKAGEESTLKSEITLAQAYLDLEQWRLGERLNIDWQQPEPLLDIPLPTLTLQPLLENAINHGIERLHKGGYIKIQILSSQKSTSIVITNPLPNSTDDSPGNGVALDNIRKRLELNLGTQAKLITGHKDQIYRVKLVIPHANTDR